MVEGKTGVLTRRNFLKSTALTAGAMAVAGAAGCSSVDTSGKASDQAARRDESGENTFVNTCRSNCGGPCVLEGKVRDGKLVSVMPKSLPGKYEGVNQGCIKGFASVLRTYGTHRILHPMRQMGERGSDNWEQITWDEAISLIAEKFKAAFDEYGARSVAVWAGAGNSRSYLSGAPFQIANYNPILGIGVSLTRFMKKTGVTYLGCGGDQAGMYMRSFVLNIPGGSVEDFQNAKTIILWGSNPADATFNKNTWHWMCKGLEKGANMIVIDPLYTDTAAHAQEWIPIRVGTDGALMCGLANYIIDHGLADEDYLKNNSVAPLLVKEDGSYLRVSDLKLDTAQGDPDDPVVWDEDAQKFVAHTKTKTPAVTGTFDAEGISVTTVYDLTVESIRPFTVEFAAKECGIPAEQIERLAQICVEGKPTMFAIDWGVEHTYNSFRLYYCAGLLASLVGGIGMPGSGWSTPSVSATSIFKASLTFNTQALDVKDAKEVKVISGDFLVEIMDSGKWAGEDYPIRCVFIQAYDPLDNASGPLRMLEAWKKIDFIVTSEQFMTTTAHYCDLVLPVSVSWEAEDFEGTFLKQKAIEPAGEAKTDFEIWNEISKAMGFDDLEAQTAEEHLREYLDTPENLEASLGYDAFHENGVIIGEYQYGETPAQESNPLGRTQFYVEHFRPRDEQGLTFPSTDRMPYYEPTIEAYPDNPDRAKYPLFGFSNHDNYHGQSLFAHNAWLDEFRTYEGQPYCRIHEQAAQERGIKTGDTVRAFNDHGEVVLKAVVTKGIQAESVWFPHGFFWDEFEKGFAQSLTGHYPDPQTCNANFNDFICQVEKYEGGAE